jgi:hypothetical protein
MDDPHGFGVTWLCAAGVGLPELPEDMLEQDVEIKIQDLGLIHPESARAKTTVLAQERLDRLSEKVVEDDYILRVDIPRFFQVSFGSQNPSESPETPERVKGYRTGPLPSRI